MMSSSSRKELLVLYKQLLRSAETFPSKNRKSIYQAIREEWRDYVNCVDSPIIHRQLSVAYKGLSQLRQYDERSMVLASSERDNENIEAAASWTITLEQNPMPKPADYDERVKTKKIK